MPSIPQDKDALEITYTFTFGNASVEANEPASGSLKPLFAAFRKHVARLQHMALAPALVGDLAHRIQRFNDIAEFEITGTLQKGRAGVFETEKALQIFTRTKELLQEDTQRFIEAKEKPEELQELVRTILEIGGVAAVLLSSTGTTQAFDALFYTYITSTWTFFETLAGDLWEACVNEKPNKLAMLRGDSGRLKKEGKPASPGVKAEKYERQTSVEIALLQYHRWNLAEKMGTVLKPKFRFTSLEGIREAYGAAFHEKCEKIDEILSDTALDNLSALRNVIAHKAGIADREYIARTRYLADLPKVSEGDAIPLKGKLVAHTMGETVFCAGTLIDAADKWLIAN